MNKIPEIMYRDVYATVAMLLGLIYGYTTTYMANIWRANILIISCLIVRLLAEFFDIHLWKPKN